MMVCSKCGAEQPDGEFRDRRTCRQCENQYQREYYENNKEMMRARKREWMRQWRIDNPEKARARQQARNGNESDRQRAREYLVILRDEHFFVYRAKRHMRKNRGNITALDLAGLWKKQRGRCALTGRKLDRDAHLDHIMPLVRGGEDELDNLQWTTPEANLAKRDLTNEEFLQLSQEVVEWIAHRMARVLEEA